MCDSSTGLRAIDYDYDASGSYTRSTCLVLFSGGRDSTLAALRLADQFGHLALVTVTSGHLFGLAEVRARVAELRAKLPSAEWINVKQPRLDREHDKDARTCLPCHLAYTVAAVRILQDRQWQDLAMGYAGYQSTWPEQTPTATKFLTAELQRIDIRLHLPTYSVASKEEAIDELDKYRVTTSALEQKCELQKFHRSFGEAELDRRLSVWAKSLRTVFRAPPQLEILEVIEW